MNLNFTTIANGFKSLLPAFILLLICGSLIACDTVNNDTLLFPEIKAWDLKGLTITDENDNILVLKRKNCVWTIGPETLATNELLVTILVDQIIGISYRKTIEKNKSMYANYRVDTDSFNYKIDLSLPGGQTKTLFLGSDGDSNVKYARITSDEKIYVLGESLGNIIMESAFLMKNSD